MNGGRDTLPGAIVWLVQQCVSWMPACWWKNRTGVVPARSGVSLTGGFECNVNPTQSTAGQASSGTRGKDESGEGWQMRGVTSSDDRGAPHPSWSRQFSLRILFQLVLAIGIWAGWVNLLIANRNASLATVSALTAAVLAVGGVFGWIVAGFKWNSRVWLNIYTLILLVVFAVEIVYSVVSTLS